MELCQHYYDQLGESTNLVRHIAEEKDQKEDVEHEIYQCSACWTQYDSIYGDPTQGIPAGTTFEQVPDDYCCPTCEAPKPSFIKKSTMELSFGPSS